MRMLEWLMKLQVGSVRKPAPASSAEMQQQSVALIRAHRLAGPKEQVAPFRIHQSTSGDIQCFSVEFEDPNTLAEGTIYREWGVAFRKSGEASVFCGRARRRGNGCDTLPPEE